ncbi:glycosyltransferase family 4 protein [Pseudothioglobus sp. nBUS_23]|uniref:glycosyltransferase family 4 protein n=1 Tax=Pseudothioglobus sp. nBUS_23 TaxID=3395318 RepID=UPI003EC00008
MTVKVFLSHQINALSKIYDVSIITNLNGKPIFLENISDQVRVISIPIKREINIFSDFYVLFLLIYILHKNKFSLIHSVSPKAGLLAAISAWIVRVPNRLHTFTGQVWVHKKGIARILLKSLDQLIIKLNTLMLVDSESQKKFLIKENLLNEENGLVLGKGSLSGVDIKRFKPSKFQKDKLRNNLNIPNDGIVFLFLGRIKEDKGIFELVKAFLNVSRGNDNTYLLIVGPDEDRLQESLYNLLGNSSKYLRFIDFTSLPEHYMMASDIFVIPSYREGFGSVVIEAASCAIPSIGTNIYGLSDAIQDDITGILVSLKSESELESAMKKLVDNEKLRLEMGLRAQKYVCDNFSQEKISSLILKLYEQLI